MSKTFFTPAKPYTVTISGPRGVILTVRRDEFVEGEWFRRYSFLKEVAESQVDPKRVVFEQAKLTPLPFFLEPKAPAVPSPAVFESDDYEDESDESAGAEDEGAESDNEEEEEVAEDSDETEVEKEEETPEVAKPKRGRPGRPRKVK